MSKRVKINTLKEYVHWYKLEKELGADGYYACLQVTYSFFGQYKEHDFTLECVIDNNDDCQLFLFEDNKDKCMLDNQNILVKDDVQKLEPEMVEWVLYTALPEMLGVPADELRSFLKLRSDVEPSVEAIYHAIYVHRKEIEDVLNQQQQ